VVIIGLQPGCLLVGGYRFRRAGVAARECAGLGFQLSRLRLGLPRSRGLLVTEPRQLARDHLRPPAGDLLRLLIAASAVTQRPGNIRVRGRQLLSRPSCLGLLVYPPLGHISAPLVGGHRRTLGDFGGVPLCFPNLPCCLARFPGQPPGLSFNDFLNDPRWLRAGRAARADSRSAVQLQFVLDSAIARPDRGDIPLNAPVQQGLRNFGTLPRAVPFQPGI